MKAICDFIPAYCPNCGAPMNINKSLAADYIAGCVLYCHCGAEIVNAPQAVPVHCANCGNVLEGESNPSKIYRGAVCDVCADLEK